LYVEEHEHPEKEKTVAPVVMKRDTHGT